MNIGCFNIRGCGNSIKSKRLQQILQKGNTNMCLLQEIEAQVVNDELVVVVWEDEEVEWSAKVANGLSRDMLIMWLL